MNDEIKRDGGRSLRELEQKITKAILPVKSRLMERLQQQQQQQLISGISQSNHIYQTLPISDDSKVKSNNKKSDASKKSKVKKGQDPSAVPTKVVGNLGDPVLTINSQCEYSEVPNYFENDQLYKIEPPCDYLTMGTPFDYSGSYGDVYGGGTSFHPVDGGRYSQQPPPVASSSTVAAGRMDFSYFHPSDMGPIDFQHPFLQHHPFDGSTYPPPFRQIDGFVPLLPRRDSFSQYLLDNEWSSPPLVTVPVQVPPPNAKRPFSALDLQGGEDPKQRESNCTNSEATSLETNSLNSSSSSSSSSTGNHIYLSCLSIYSIYLSIYLPICGSM